MMIMTDVSYIFGTTENKLQANLNTSFNQYSSFTPCFCFQSKFDVCKYVNKLLNQYLFGKRNFHAAYRVYVRFEEIE